MDKRTIQSIAKEFGIELILNPHPVTYIKDHPEMEIWDDWAPTTAAQAAWIGQQTCVVHREIVSSTCEPVLHEICHLIAGVDEADAIELEISLLDVLIDDQAAPVRKVLREGIPHWEIHSEKIDAFMRSMEKEA